MSSAIPKFTSVSLFASVVTNSISSIFRHVLIFWLNVSSPTYHQTLQTISLESGKALLILAY